MPTYEFKCRECGKVFERVYSVRDITLYAENLIYIICDCGGISDQQIAKTFSKIFHGQVLTNLCHDAPYVGSMRDVKDAINRFNDSELASKQGRIALSDQ